MADPERKLACMIVLHQAWQAWQQGRVDALLMAAAMVDASELSVVDVCAAMQISAAAYYRHCHSLRPVAGSVVEREAAVQVEAALRGAGVDLDGKTLDEVKAQIAASPDAELALAGIGVWRARDQGD